MITVGRSGNATTNSEKKSDLKISFRRTIRVPESSTLSELPPDLGAFPLYPIDGPYVKQIPETMRAKGGLFFPMHYREAMWLDFKSRAPFAIKIYIGGVNVVSGDVNGEETANYLRRTAKLARAESMQDYVVVPAQKWIDGVAISSGQVRQFVATYNEAGYSVESQLTGSESVAGLQFEVTPLATFQVFVKLLSGRTITIEVASSSTVEDLKRMVTYSEGIPSGKQRLVFAGKSLENGRTLGTYAIRAESTVHLTSALKGGATKERHSVLDNQYEMNLAAGGAIQQHIQEDQHDASDWQKDRTTVFNVQILNSALFRTVTGLEPPPCPIDAKTYKALGYSFFDIPEAVSNIHGTFDGITGHDTMFIRRKLELWTKSNSEVTLNPNRSLGGFSCKSEIEKEVGRRGHVVSWKTGS